MKARYFDISRRFAKADDWFRAEPPFIGTTSVIYSEASVAEFCRRLQDEASEADFPEASELIPALKQQISPYVGDAVVLDFSNVSTATIDVHDLRPQLDLIYEENAREWGAPALMPSRYLLKTRAKVSDTPKGLTPEAVEYLYAMNARTIGLETPLLSGFIREKETVTARNAGAGSTDTISGGAGGSAAKRQEHDLILRQMENVGVYWLLNLDLVDVPAPSSGLLFAAPVITAESVGAVPARAFFVGLELPDK